MRQIWYWLKSLITGRVESRSGRVGLRPERSRIRRYLPWAIAALLPLALLVWSISKIDLSSFSLPSFEGVGVPKTEPSPAPIEEPATSAQIVDNCTIVDNNSRVYVAVDCLTFAESAKAVYEAHPLPSVLAILVIFIAGAVFGWQMRKRYKERAK